MDMTEQDILIDAPLEPDPDATEEMGPAEAQAIADEDLKGSRLLLVRRAVEAVDLDGWPGGAVQLTCTFQPADNCRFASARLVLKLTTPAGVRFGDVQPVEVREDEPVKFVLESKGKLGLKYLKLEGGTEAGEKVEYATYHCAVTGAGDGTQLASWSFKENPFRRDGLGSSHALAFTIPAVGRVAGEAIVTARLIRPGLSGAADAIRDLILGPPKGSHYPVSFDIPTAQPTAGLLHFLRLE